MAIYYASKRAVKPTLYSRWPERLHHGGSTINSAISIQHVLRERRLNVGRPVSLVGHTDKLAVDWCIA